MRLRIHSATANEELVALLNEGYDAVSTMQRGYQQKKNTGTYDDSKDVAGLVAPVEVWAKRVINSRIKKIEFRVTCKRSF